MPQKTGFTTIENIIGHKQSGVVSFETIIEKIKLELANKGYVITSEEYKINTKNTVTLGTLCLDKNRYLAWSQSYEKGGKFRIGSGTCGPAVVISHIDSEPINSQPLIFRDIEEAINLLGQVPSDTLETTRVNPETMCSLLGGLIFQEELLSITQIAIVQRTLVTPTTMYDLYRIIAGALKESHPGEYITSMNKLCEIMLAECKSNPVEIIKEEVKRVVLGEVKYTPTSTPTVIFM